MYEFVGINEIGQEQLSSVAMSYDGAVLDEVIEGFRTLNVEGRETTSLSINKIEMDVGYLDIGQRMESPPLEVEYMIQRDTQAELKESFRQLMKAIVRDRNVEIMFADEDARHYGRFQQFLEWDEGNNQVIGKMSLYRHKPYKYGPLLTTNGSLITTEKDLSLVRIVIKPTASTSQLKISNGKQEIRLVEKIGASDSIELNFVENRVYKNGVGFDYALALDSDFENFVIESGQTVSSGQATLSIEYRERWL